MTRKLGENDPGRYQITILIGPCTLDQAILATERAEEALRELGQNLGPAAALSTFDEPPPSTP